VPVVIDTMEDLANHSADTGWLSGGVPFHIPGNGGPDCVQFLSTYQRVGETLVFTCLSLMLFLCSYKSLTSIQTVDAYMKDRTGKKTLLGLFGLVFGMEIGFKLATRQLIWLLNPCHMLSFLQIFLLVAPNNKVSTVLFRLHIYWLTGPLLAILFPVTNTLDLPLEWTIYWVQHLMLLLIPLYLIKLGGQFSLEPLSDLAWPATAFSLYSLYHWLVLQPIGLLLQTNLNSMICPAISDPFHGPYYRMVAMTHQSIMVPLVGKLYAVLAQQVLSLWKLNNNENKKEN